MVKNLLANAIGAKDMGSIPGSGRSSGEGSVNPLQYSCLRIPWTEKSCGLQSMGLLSMPGCACTPMFVEALFTIGKI